VSVVIAGPPTRAVQWRCRRCGRRGIAQTLIPIGPDWDESMIRVLLDTLRFKLQRVHGCVAAVDDFEVSAYVPPATRMIDRL
jgi:hypothetical protein